MLTDEFPMVVCEKRISLRAASDGHTSEASVGIGTEVSISVYIMKLKLNLIAALTQRYMIYSMYAMREPLFYTLFPPSPCMQLLMYRATSYFLKNLV